MENKRTEKNLSRSTIICDNIINLTQTDPLDRLQELCKQGNYRYKFNWDKFQNGIMIECELFYFLNRSRRILHQEAKFIKSKDLSHVKRVIATSILQNIGLGINDEEITKNITHGITAVAGIIDKVSTFEKMSWADICPLEKVVDHREVEGARQYKVAWTEDGAPKEAWIWQDEMDQRKVNVYERR